MVQAAKRSVKMVVDVRLRGSKQSVSALMTTVDSSAKHVRIFTVLSADELS